MAGYAKRRFVGGKPVLRDVVEAAPPFRYRSVGETWPVSVGGSFGGLPGSTGLGRPRSSGRAPGDQPAGLPGFGMRSPPGSPPRSGPPACRHPATPVPAAEGHPRRGCVKGGCGSPCLPETGPPRARGPISAQGASAVGGFQEAFSRARSLAGSKRRRVRRFDGARRWFPRTPVPDASFLSAAFVPSTRSPPRADDMGLSRAVGRRLSRVVSIG